MTLPSQPWVELPLLLELERAAGKVSPGPGFYDKVAAHFPQIEPADRQLLRKDGRTKVWENTVDWARNSLLAKGELSGRKGTGWQITQNGRTRLRKDLQSLGLPAADLDGFISGSGAISLRLGNRWSPKPLRLRGSGRPKPHTVHMAEPKPQEEIQDARVVEGPIAGPRVLLLERVKVLDDNQFERLCGRLLQAMGFEGVCVTGRSHDRGIDGHATLRYLGLQAAFHAKNWRNNQ